MDIEQVAVVGLAGRFPGAPNIDQFWQNLCHGVEARTLFSDEELRANVDPALLAYPGYVKSGFVLEEIEYFDADFFRFDAQQARITDPQQRLFLECVWEALETAGIDVTTYGGLVGVYAGASQSSYWAHARAGMVGTVGNVLAELIGNDKDYLATQTAYRLNLQGPCLSVQSACSTGLVAVHLACQSLLNHECDVALAGGVTVHVPHRVGYVHAEGSVFAADGRCCAFSAQATGMVFGNGIGVVVLKRLSEALADGDFIWAVVRGSAVNNDGARKFGFMTSSRMGQIEVITEAWGIAGVTAPELSYIETHGSGTPLGDVIEFSALAKLFGEVDPRGKSCAIGSVKSNVGHLETAAGITGFIKTVLALHHRQLPPSINFATPNPDIDFAQTPLYLNTTLTDWQLRPELGQHRRCAGVSSFGIGGTNAHVVLEEAPEGDTRPEGTRETRAQRAPARHETSLAGGGFAEMVDDGIVVEEIWDDELVPVEKVAAAQPLRLLNLSAKNGQALRALAQRYVAFLAQATAVDFGDLCYTAQVGRSHFAQRLSLVAASAAEAQAKLSAFLYQADSQKTGVQVGTVASTPPKVAFFFGGDATTFPDGGGELYATQPRFRQAFDHCAALAAPYLDQPLTAFLSASNPASVASPTAPGPLLYRFAIDYALAALWQAWELVPDLLSGQGVGDYVAATVAGVFSLADALKLLAAHSKMVLNPNGQFNSVAGQLAYRAPTIALIDGRTGQLLGGEVATAAYWAQGHLDPPADHKAALTALAAQGNVVITSQGSWAAILAQVGELYRAGAAINWQAFYQGSEVGRTPCKVPLPTYPFQRQRYWVELAAAQLPHAPPIAAPAPRVADEVAAVAAKTVPPPTWAQLSEGDQSPTLRQMIAAAAKADQADLLVDYLQEVVAQILIASNAAPTPLPTIGLTVGFAELGMTSLGAVAMRNQLQSDLGHKLPATLVLDYPTVASLADYLMQHVLPQLAVDAPAAPDAKPGSAFIVDNIAKPVPSATAAVDALSVDEIAERLAAKLGIKLS